MLSQSVLDDNHTVTLANGLKSVNGPDYLGVERAFRKGKYYANALRTDAVRRLREVLIPVPGLRALQLNPTGLLLRNCHAMCRSRSTRLNGRA